MNTFQLKTLQKQLENEYIRNYIYLRDESVCFAEALDKKFNVENADAEDILEMVVAQIAIKNSKDGIENICFKLNLGIEDVTQRLTNHLLSSVEMLFIKINE